MPITFRNVYSTFTAGEAEPITGVSTTTQRDWRRHKYLPAGKDGWTQFEAMDLARLLAMGALKERGIGPSVSQNIAQSAALRIMIHALSRPGAFEDLTDGEFERISRRRGERGGSRFASTSTGEVERYLIVWADGGMGFTSDLDAAFGEATDSTQYQGAIIVLDLEALGWLLVERAKRPLLTVECKDK